MKRIYYFCLASAISLFALNGHAQNVGINEDGSVPNPNAILDVKSFNKGLLIPRVSSSGRLAIPNTKGLLVYDTTVNSFWYNTGAGWQNFASPGGFWSLKGNSGTDSSSFLGTTDNKSLIVKVNNQPAGRIETQYPNNTAWGYNAGGISTSGEPNTAIGAYSMQSNTNGGYNVSVGDNALQANTQGAFNTAIGSGSMSQAKGSYNTAVGSYTLQHTTGIYNMAFGGGALSNNTTGFGNIGIGFQSLLQDTSGSQNTATGLFTMNANTSGGSNTANGSYSMTNNTTGYANTAIGANTMAHNTTGSNNTALGQGAMNACTTGGENTLIGSDADISTGTLSNATAIGFAAIVNASNKVRIGNSWVTVIEGQVPFTTPSDGRYKYQVKEDVKGLDFILQLRPVTYQFDVKRFDQNTRHNDKETVPVNYAIQAGYDEASRIRRSGFIAQEVEKAADVSGYNFSGIIKPKTDEDHYSLSYESFVVPLVKSVQELKAIIADQQKQIDELKKLVSK